MTQETWTAVDEYLTDRFVGIDAALDATLETSSAAGLPDQQFSPTQGKFLMLLARAIGARSILEIGTLGGYSAIWLARALPSDGHLVTLERDPRHAEVARQNFELAGLADRISLHVGPALETLAQWRAPPMMPFDLIFIDADKPNNLGYVQAALTLS